MNSTTTDILASEPEVPLTIGAQIKLAREKLCFSQEQLATACAIDKSKIAYAESEYNITLMTQMKIARGLKKAGYPVRLQIDPDAQFPKAKPWNKAKVAKK